MFACKNRQMNSLYKINIEKTSCAYKTENKFPDNTNEIVSFIDIVIFFISPSALHWDNIQKFN